MHRGIGVLCLLLLGLFLGVAFSQDEEKPKETKTTAEKPVVTRDPIGTDRMWSFYYEGVQKRGAFLEMAQPDAENEGKGRILVITSLEVRQSQSMRWRLVEHQKDGKKWKKVVRRGELFSQGWMDGTSKNMVAGYWGWVGMKFGPTSRPSIEMRQGSGEIAVYAEGYWAD